MENPENIKMWSINEKLREFEEKKKIRLENESAQKPKFSFLEDVPDWQEKQKLYELANYFQERVNKKDLFHARGENAARDVRDINDRFGKGTATYVESGSLFGKQYCVRIERPSKIEYADILGEDGKLLPHREISAQKENLAA